MAVPPLPTVGDRAARGGRPGRLRPTPTTLSLDSHTTAMYLMCLYVEKNICNVFPHQHNTAVPRDHAKTLVRSVLSNRSGELLTYGGSPAAACQEGGPPLTPPRGNGRLGRFQNREALTPAFEVPPPVNLTVTTSDETDADAAVRRG